MSAQQPKALRLAECLDDVTFTTRSQATDAAAELRRLHIEVGQYKAARIGYASEFPVNAEGLPDVENIHRNIRNMKFMRDDLLEALKAMIEVHGVTQSYADKHIEIPQSWVEVSEVARAAIAKAGGAA